MSYFITYQTLLAHHVNTQTCMIWLNPVIFESLLTFSHITTIALNKVVHSTFVTIHLSRNETEYMIEKLVNLFYNYLALWWVGHYLNSCHILPSFLSFSVLYLSLLFVMAVFLLLPFSVLITLTANSQLLNKWNISLSFHLWVSTSPKKGGHEDGILFFLFLWGHRTKIRRKPSHLGGQTAHWNPVCPRLRTH